MRANGRFNVAAPVIRATARVRRWVTATQKRPQLR
jgi:hypothetical protein